MISPVVKRLLERTPEDVKIFVDLYTNLQMRIAQILEDKQMTQKDLAGKLGKQPSEISKWLNGEHNFTLRSLAKLQAELGEVLLEVPQSKPKVCVNKVKSFKLMIPAFAHHFSKPVENNNAAVSKFTGKTTVNNFKHDWKPAIAV